MGVGCKKVCDIDPWLAPQETMVPFKDSWECPHLERFTVLINLSFAFALRNKLCTIKLQPLYKKALPAFKTSTLKEE